jgi:hypothetical protein
VEVGDPHPPGGGVALDPHGLDDLLELEQAGRGRAVGEEQPSATKLPSCSGSPKSPP